MSDILDALRAYCPHTELKENEPMALHTTMRVGGPADIMAFPASLEELCGILSTSERLGMPAMVVGNGSNLLVRDGGIRGVVILTSKLNEVRIEGRQIIAQSGALLSRIASAALNAGLAGFEFASGIPGSLGGAVAMNAGAYGGQMSDVVQSAEIFRDGRVMRLSTEELAFGYRKSSILAHGGIVLSVQLMLERGDEIQIRAYMDELNAKRRNKQPLDMPSCGSTFKRPEGYFAGALIEDAGLKGYSVGGARVSEKHAGFVVNTGGAAAKDVLLLIDHVQHEVYRYSGVMLEPEVRIVGEEA